MNIKDITYRNVAKMLSSALPVEGQEFGDKVNHYMQEIKKLSSENKIALKHAYIFSRKAPKQDREDLFQELLIALLEANTPDKPLSYAIARCDWRNWWERRMTRSHYLGGSLNKTIETEEGSYELGELLVGEVEFERKMDDKIDTETLYNKLPDFIKPLIDKRLAGRGLNNTQRSTLNRWNKRTGYSLILA